MAWRASARPRATRFSSPYRRFALKPAILSVASADLDAWFASAGEPAYRRKQVMSWVARGARSFDEMRDVPRQLRDRLGESFRITSLKPVAVSEADSGETTKTLFEIGRAH